MSEQQFEDNLVKQVALCQYVSLYDNTTSGLMAQIFVFISFTTQICHPINFHIFAWQTVVVELKEKTF